MNGDILALLVVLAALIVLWLGARQEWKHRFAWRIEKVTTTSDSYYVLRLPRWAQTLLAWRDTRRLERSHGIGGRGARR